MPTTSNFGWTTPADTDLVKDGAAAIRTLGNGIDTSLVDLKGGTTGQVLSKASNTDLDFTWSSVDPLTILDAKGDLITATAADTPARLAVGTNGHVLTADSSTSTGLKWASASSTKTFSLLNAGGTALTGAATITVSSIGGYDDYYIFVDDASTTAANSAIGVRLNGDSTGYDQFGASWAYETTYNAANFAQYSNTGNTQFIFALTSDSNAVVAGGVEIRGANNTGPKIAIAIGGQSNGSSNGGRNYITMGQVDAGGAAVTSISLFSSSGDFDAGTMYIYGAV